MKAIFVHLFSCDWYKHQLPVLYLFIFSFLLADKYLILWADKWLFLTAPHSTDESVKVKTGQSSIHVTKRMILIRAAIEHSSRNYCKCYSTDVTRTGETKKYVCLLNLLRKIPFNQMCGGQKMWWYHVCIFFVGMSTLKTLFWM